MKLFALSLFLPGRSLAGPHPLCALGTHDAVATSVHPVPGLSIDNPHRNKPGALAGGDSAPFSRDPPQEICD
jgi:hypothetical protein